MIKVLKSKISLILLFFFIATKSYAINNYDYPKKNLEPGICEKIYSELNFPHPNYELEDPTILKTDLFVDRIYEVTPKNGTFEAINLWLTWKELRLIPILKNTIYILMKKPFYLCSFDQNLNFQITKCLTLLLRFTIGKTNLQWKIV